MREGLIFRTPMSSSGIREGRNPCCSIWQATVPEPSLGLLLGERTHQAHEIPAHFFLRSIAFPRHFSLAVADDPEQFAVGHLLDGSSVPPVAQLEFHVGGKIALAVARFSMTHGAVVAKELAHFR